MKIKFVTLILFLLIPIFVFSKSDTLNTINNLKNYFSSNRIADTIFINEGIYFENNIYINKSDIVIIGINNPVIDAKKESEIFVVEANNVTVKGITFRNTGISFVNDLSAIKVQNSKGCKILDNILENSFFAIYLANSSNIYVCNNLILGNSLKESFSGNGIHLWNCKNVLILNNVIHNQRDGIYLEFTTNSIILNNHSYKNLRYGLHFMFSEGNKYIYNEFSQNGAGVAVMYTKNIVMVKNKFYDNWGENSYGLLLKDIDNSIISFNNFSKNTVGIYSEGSNNLKINNNNFSANGWAVKLLGNCYFDSIKFNSFNNNMFDVSSNSSVNNNRFESNFWDKYKGYDLGKDGVGDVPYRPVNLFSLLIEISPDAIILLNSFAVDMLDLAEKISPSFTPESLIDETPLMEGSIYVKN